MNPHEYIVSQLRALSNVYEEVGDVGTLEHRIFARVTNKKFRKYSCGEEAETKIREAIHLCVSRNEPIVFGWPFGGYKLWRLAEAPKAEWAELFTVMYLARWLRPICALYPPGVHFRFCAQDLLAERLNNLTSEETGAYQRSFEDVLRCVHTYVPANMRFEYVALSTLYTAEEFSRALDVAVAEYHALYPHVVHDARKRDMTLLNTRPTYEQLRKGDAWVEDVCTLHDASMKTLDMSRLRNLYRAPETICVFSVPIGGNSIGVGTTKTSIAKFWVGVGALQRTKDGGYIETVLSPTQLERAVCTYEDVRIPEVVGQEWEQVRVVDAR